MIEHFYKKTEGDIQEDILVRTLVIDEIKMKIPVSLKDMPDEVQRMHYPYDDKPNVILYDEHNKTELTFQEISEVNTEYRLDNIVSSIWKYVEETIDYVELYPIRFLKTNTISSGWFLLKLTLEENIMNHRKYVLLLHNKIYLLTITYPENEDIKWGNITKKILFSIEVENEKNIQTRY